MKYTCKLTTFPFRVELILTIIILTFLSVSSGSVGKPPKPSRSSIEDTAVMTAAAGQSAATEETGEEEVFPPPSSPPGVSYLVPYCL